MLSFFNAGSSNSYCNIETLSLKRKFFNICILNFIHLYLLYQIHILWDA